MSMTMLMLWAALIAARGTPAGAVLHRWLVARPAALLARLRRDTMVTATVLVVLGSGVWWVMGHEGVQLYSMALPELTGMLAMLDVTAWVDIAIALVVAGSGAGWTGLRAMAQRYRPRAPRTRRVRRTGKPAANDDGDGPAFALAA